MKILYLLSQVPSGTGSGIYTRSMITRAVQAGHRCALVAACSAACPPDAGAIPAERIDWVPFDRDPLPYPIPGMSDVMPYPSTRFIDLTEHDLDVYERIFERAVQDAVAAERPDIIHSNHLWLLTAAARRNFPDIPLVVSCHGTDLRQLRNCPHIGKRIIGDIRRVDGIFALTESQKADIKALFGVPETLLHLSPNGFDPEVFHPADKLPVPPVTLLYAGKLSRSKGVHQLLEALNHDSLRNLSVRVLLAGSGSGPDADRCRDLAGRSAVPVTFCGSLSPRDLGVVMRESHLFVLPSYFEGLPLVIIEALASGCRVVATGLPGIRELVAGIPAEWSRLYALPALETQDRPFDGDLPLIRNRLADTLGHAIREILENGMPPSGLFDSLKREYSWEHIFKRAESVYRSLA
jgi:glycosyltransferase involved in cell wall biosynthesis